MGYLVSKCSPNASEGTYHLFQAVFGPTGGPGRATWPGTWKLNYNIKHRVGMRQRHGSRRLRVLMA